MKSTGCVAPHLRIVVVNPATPPGAQRDAALAGQAQRSAALRIGLLESGYDLVASLPADVFLPERVAQLQPDMIIVDSASDARDVLEHIVIATRDARRPIVLFTEDDAPASMDAALADMFRRMHWRTSSPLPLSASARSRASTSRRMR